MCTLFRVHEQTCIVHHRASSTTNYYIIGYSSLWSTLFNEQTVKRVEGATTPRTESEAPLSTVLKETALIHSKVARYGDEVRPRPSGRSPCARTLYRKGEWRPQTRLHCHSSISSPPQSRRVAVREENTASAAAFPYQIVSISI